jgi:hypothetical protein
MSDEKFFELRTIGRLRQRRAKPNMLYQMSPADDRSRATLNDISRDFELVLGRSVRARHRESGDEMSKDAFRHFCDRHYGEVRLVDEHGVESDHPSGVYWWDAGHDLEGRRVIARSSRTAEETLVVPRKREGEDDEQ